MNAHCLYTLPENNYQYMVAQMRMSGVEPFCDCRKCLYFENRIKAKTSPYVPLHLYDSRVFQDSLRRMHGVK